MTKPKTPKGLPAPATALPDPSPSERAAIAAARQRMDERMASRRKAPRIKIKALGEKTHNLISPHSDKRGHADRLVDALGTTSNSFSSQTINLLISAGSAKRDPSPDDVECTINAGLAFINAAEPENEIETALVSQMFATHVLGMNLMSRASRADNLDALQACVTAATKVQRTFVAQIEALAKLKSKGKQVVEVRHVHVYGNAVIGDVRTGGGDGGASEFDRQPHAVPELPGENHSAVRCEDPKGHALFVGAGAGPQALPDARRGAGKRSAVRPGQRSVSARPADQGSGRDVSSASEAAGRGARDDEAPPRLGRRRPTPDRAT